ncbi:MAG: Nif11-like leader peptide family natural product precursor [Acidobacteriota bacterium]|nr:Nif11-like leader peptide family natural product precursor [Acidobacteriota bacterium]
MGKENLERFMKQVAESEDLQAKIGEEITGDALVVLGQHMVASVGLRISRGALS